MFRYVFSFLQLHIITADLPWQTETGTPDVVSTLLRGSQASNTSKAASKLYTHDCHACAYKSAQCGCAPAMDYLACLTTHCYPSDQNNFVKMCAALQSHCYSELDIECSGSSTVCKGKFHQLSHGGLGLTWDPTAMFDNAFCGPFGSCIGEIHMTVSIHVPPVQAEPKKPAEGKTAVAACKDMQDGACKDTKDLTPFHKVPMFLECGLPKHAHADIDHKDDWSICTSEVSGDVAKCDLPMTSKLEAQQSLESYCVLTEGKGGRRLTQPVWRNIANTVKKSRVYTAPKHVEQPETQHEEEVIAMPNPYTKKRDTEPVPKKSFEVDVDVDARDMVPSEDSLEDFDKAAERPPWMKYSDAEKKGDTPGTQIIKHIESLKPADRAAQAVSSATNTTRAGSRALAADIERMEAEVEKAEKRSEEMARHDAERVQEGTVEGASRVRKQGGRVSRTGGDAVDEVRAQKPPWMKYSDAPTKAPLIKEEERNTWDRIEQPRQPGRVTVDGQSAPVVAAVRMLNEVPQSPIMMKLA